MELMEDIDNGRAIKLIRGGALYLLSGATIFSLEVIVYVAQGWKHGWLWWVGNFAGTGCWLIAPYAGMGLLLTRRKFTLRQEIIHLFGAFGIVSFGILMFLDGFFLHADPRNWILYVLVPVYQWLAIAGAWAISYAVGKTLR